MLIVSTFAPNTIRCQTQLWCQFPVYPPGTRFHLCLYRTSTPARRELTVPLPQAPSAYIHFSYVVLSANFVAQT